MFQVFLKYIFIKDLRHLVVVLRYVENIYEANVQKDAKNHLLCMKFARISRTIIFMVPIMYSACNILIGSASVVESVYTGELKPPFMIYAPSIYGEAELYIDVPMFVANVASILCAVVVLCSYDILIHMTFFNMPLLATIIVVEINEFQETLNEGHLDRIDVKKKLLRVIRMQEEYKMYVEIDSNRPGIDLHSHFPSQEYSRIGSRLWTIIGHSSGDCGDV